MFYGCEFSYNGISCATFGLALYNFGGSKSSGFDFTSPAEFDEDPSRHGYRNRFYGQKQKEPIEIKLTFGLIGERLDRGVDVRDPRYLRRSEINAITSWLTGTRGYRRLEIDQPDMKDYYYKAHCTKLSLIGDDWHPYGFEATFECDSPYAYQDRTVIVADITSADVEDMGILGTMYKKMVYLPNDSAYGGDIRPIVHIDISPADESTPWPSGSTAPWISFINYFDSEIGLDLPAVMGFNNLPMVRGRLTVDCEKCLITHSDKEHVDPSDLYASSTAGFLKIHPANETFTRFRDGHTGETAFLTTEKLTAESVSGVQQVTVSQRPARIQGVSIDGTEYTQDTTAIKQQTFTYDKETGVLTFAADEPTIEEEVDVDYYSPFFEQWAKENEAGVMADMDVGVNPICILAGSPESTKFKVTFEYDCPVDIGG